MKTFFKNIIFAALIVCMSGSVFAEGVSKEVLLNRIKEASKSSPCLFFESYGKYPHAIVYYPRKNEVRDILFACEKEGSVEFVEEPGDFANLVPAKLKVAWPLCGIYTEKKFEGFVADKMVMKAISSASYEEQFKKPFMVAEYESGMDMKWVFSSAEQFQGFKNYFLKNIQTPAPKKPFLVLEIEKNADALTDEDFAFLDQYFDVADVSDDDQDLHAQEVSALIKMASNDVSDYAKNQVGKSLHDMVTEDIESTFCAFENKKLIKKALIWSLAGVLIAIPVIYATELKKALTSHLPGIQSIRSLEKK